MTYFLTASHTMHTILENLYREMMPLCDSIVLISRIVAGLALLTCIGYRVWRSLGEGKPLVFMDFFRPVAMCFLVSTFTFTVIPVVNGILHPIVRSTELIVQRQENAIREAARVKEQLLEEQKIREEEIPCGVENREFDEELSSLGIMDIKKISQMYMERAQYRFRQMLREAMLSILEMIFTAAAVVIDTLRTFFLIVLTILGPISFALSVFDVFSSSATQWLTRYTAIYLWSAIANVFSGILARIQTVMYEHEIETLRSGESLSSEAEMTSIIFMIIGILGYTAIPSVSAWIIGSGREELYDRVSSSTLRTAAFATGVISGLGGKGGKQTKR